MCSAVCWGSFALVRIQRFAAHSHLKMVAADFYWEYDCMKTQKIPVSEYYIDFENILFYNRDTSCRRCIQW